MSNNYNVFDLNTLEYDQWYDLHSTIYKSELLAIKKLIPNNKKGIEIGCGTGRFAEPLNIKFGVEPSENMAKVSEQRGVYVFKALAEDLPIDDGYFDFALMVTTLCFLTDIPHAFSEVHRILKSKGEIIVAIIDKNSELGMRYNKEKSSNKFYRAAHFHSVQEITKYLKKSSFHNFKYYQTLIHDYENVIEKPIRGFGKGSFIVIKARKI